MNNKKNLGLLASKIRKYIAYSVSDKKIEVLLNLLTKHNKNFDINKKFKIKQYSYKSFIIFTKNCVAKIFFNYEDFSCEYYPIKKLNNKKFDHVINLLDFDEDNHILILEKVDIIFNDKNLLLKEYSNKIKVRKLFVIIMKSIHALFILNQQVNKDFSYKNIGMNKEGIIKIFDWELSCYIDPENKYIAKEELYRSFKNFTDEFVILLENSKLINLKNEVEYFLEEFDNKLTDIRKIEKPTISGKYKLYTFRAFKFLEFNEIINFIKRW